MTRRERKSLLSQRYVPCFRNNARMRVAAWLCVLVRLLIAHAHQELLLFSDRDRGQWRGLRVEGEFFEGLYCGAANETWVVVFCFDSIVYGYGIAADCYGKGEYRMILYMRINLLHNYLLLY